MLEVISNARAWIAEGKRTVMDSALLRNLVEANMNEGAWDGKHLTDDELLSDTFVNIVQFLEYTTAVFHETLRLFPSVPRLGKNVRQDTTLTARRFKIDSDKKVTDVEKFDVDIKRGSIVVIDVMALHNNRA
ncbi:hypothetical protein H0H81_002628 [Sphagnurus paluster]|uniref:Uncharacterized protein n=1 Tax=Sphagnurus paluster TaxID=117069 RepID=A0A9P7GR07_9AGAR|nr:hypothetical protein H0H81_002628 [Sphagnurus paluster]